MKGPNRDRLLNFRVTGEEHERLKAAVISHGCRSMSELARRAVLAMVASEDTTARATVDLQSQIENLQGRVAVLEAVATATTIRCGPLTSVAFGLAPSSSGEVKS